MKKSSKKSKNKKGFPWKGLMVLLLLSGVGAIVFIALKKPETLNKMKTSALEKSAQFKDNEQRKEMLNATMAQTNATVQSKLALLKEAFAAGRSAAKEAHSRLSAEAQQSAPTVTEEEN